MGADESEQLTLPLVAGGADLGEPGGNDDQRAYALAERRLGCVECGGRRNADDGQVDRVRHVSDRRVAANAADGLPPAVDRVAGTAEVAREDVTEELAADRATPGRSPKNGHRPWLEERPQRCGDRCVVAGSNTRGVVVGRCDRERHLDDPARPRSVTHQSRLPRRRAAWRGSPRSPLRRSVRSLARRHVPPTARAGAGRSLAFGSRRQQRRRPRPRRDRADARN